jgi:hypothetical protein
MLVASVSIDASAQACVVRGRAITHALRVDPPGSTRSFRVRIASEESAATLSAGSADAFVRARGYLEVAGAQPTASLDVSLQHPVELGGVLFVAEHGLSLSSLRMSADGVVATLSGWNLEVRDAPLPCSAVALSDPWQQRAWGEGFRDLEGVPHPCSPHYLRCAAPHVVAACHLSYSEGWAAGERARTFAVTRPAPDSSAIAVPATSTLRVHRTPRAADPLLIHVAAPDDLELEILARRGGWTRVRHAWGSSRLEGWVRAVSLRAAPERELGLGDLGTIGHGRGRGAGRGVIGIVEPGTPVFASPIATRPWATVRGTESVRLVIHESRVEVLDVPGVEVDAPGRMWVPRDRVRAGVSSGHGLALVELAHEGSRRFRVERVEPGSIADEIGLRPFDVIDGLEHFTRTFTASDLAGFAVDEVRDLLSRAPSFTVTRYGERVDLVHECRATAVRAELECFRRRQYLDCPAPPLPQCCPF